MASLALIMRTDLDRRLRSIPDRFNALSRWIRGVLGLAAIGLYIGSYFYLPNPLWTAIVVLFFTVAISAAFLFDSKLEFVPIFLLFLYTQLSEYLSDQYPAWADLLTVLLLAGVSVYILARDADGDPESNQLGKTTDETS